MRCQYAGCSGAIDDGFCDVCGRPPAGAGSHITADTGSTYTANRGTSGSSSSTSGQLMSSRSSRSRSRTARTRGTSTRRRAGLGAGLLELPAVPALDPLQAILPDQRVPERKRFCPVEECGARLSYEEGYCPNCGQAYSFKPSLAAGDVVDRKYEVKGTIAFGGLGWIYLAWAKHLARWVVIKGLLNIKDETQRELARAEARSLSAVKHPNIVQVYD